MSNDGRSAYALVKRPIDVHVAAHDATNGRSFPGKHDVQWREETPLLLAEECRLRFGQVVPGVADAAASHERRLVAVPHGVVRHEGVPLGFHSVERRLLSDQVNLGRAQIVVKELGDATDLTSWVTQDVFVLYNEGVRATDVVLVPLRRVYERIPVRKAAILEPCEEVIPRAVERPDHGVRPEVVEVGHERVARVAHRLDDLDFRMRVQFLPPQVQGQV